MEIDEVCAERSGFLTRLAWDFDLSLIILISRRDGLPLSKRRGNFVGRVVRSPLGDIDMDDLPNYIFYLLRDLKRSHSSAWIRLIFSVSIFSIFLS